MATKSRSQLRPRRIRPAIDPRSVRITNPQRVLFHDPSVTKRDLVDYYTQIADVILPHVAGRPLGLLRCPDGAAGPCFVQKHLPQGISPAVEPLRTPDNEGKDDDGLVVHDLAGLIALVQFGTLELHTWGSRADRLERPDRVIFDLDPDTVVPWSTVVNAAFALRERLAHAGLTTFVKTTGGKGLHIVVPIDRRYTWDDVKSFARDIANEFVAAAPRQFIAKSSKAARGGKIFIDYLRNGRGALTVAPYSPRARNGAPIAMPIAWEQLRRLKNARQFTLLNVPRQLGRRQSDPWAGINELRQRLTRR